MIQPLLMQPRRRRQLQEGESGERHEIVEISFLEYESLVRDIAVTYRHIATMQDMEDLLQDGYLALWESLCEAPNQANQDSGSLANRIRSRLRRSRRQQNLLYRLLPRILKEGYVELTEPMSLPVERDLICQQIERSLARLNPRQRSVIEAIYGINQPASSVLQFAKKQQKSPQAVRRLCERAYVRLGADRELKALVS
ncbi:MAG TPA: hypothetical protein V6D19_08665 [Stenomitos sp.]